ncbi:hypothetical protein GLOTRDRAFT_110779, partial [Gloeophyllum trabeum ATCC 11539]
RGSALHLPSPLSSSTTIPIPCRTKITTVVASRRASITRRKDHLPGKADTTRSSPSKHTREEATVASPGTEGTSLSHLRRLYTCNNRRRTKVELEDARPA